VKQYFPDLLKVIVNQLLEQYLITIHELEMASMISLPIKLLESPNLTRSPPINTNHKSLDKPILPRLVLQPILLQKLVLHILKLGPATLSGDFTEKVVITPPLLPVQDPFLGGPLDAAGRGLFDVDVFRVFFDVVIDVERYGRDGDQLAGEPVYALLHQDVVDIIGEGFVHEEFSG